MVSSPTLYSIFFFFSYRFLCRRRREGIEFALYATVVSIMILLSVRKESPVSFQLHSSMLMALGTVLLHSFRLCNELESKSKSKNGLVGPKETVYVL